MPITAGLIVMAALQELGKRENSIRGRKTKEGVCLFSAHPCAIILCSLQSAMGAKLAGSR